MPALRRGWAGAVAKESPRNRGGKGAHGALDRLRRRPEWIRSRYSSPARRFPTSNDGPPSVGPCLT